jgi:6,7-dimethyl-8-ribityllumazine synthase
MKASFRLRIQNCHCPQPFQSVYFRHLLDGALEALGKLGVEEANIEIYKVPGAFEVLFWPKNWLRKNRLMA